MKKKVFRNESLNRICRLEHAIWLVPVFFFLLSAWKSRSKITEILEAEHSLVVIIGLICFLAFIAFLESIIPFAILKVFFRKMKKQVIKNNSFIPIEDFDYYRDKLTGLSPAMISIISDLEIEQRKDVAASILKYEEMGILKVEGNNYEAGDYQNADLRESDKYLIEGLVNHTFNMENDREWRKLVEKEAEEEGYLKNPLSRGKRGFGKKQTGCGCGGGCLMPILLFILFLVVTFHANANTGELEAILEAASDDMSFGQQLEYLGKYPQVYPVIAEMILALVLFILTIISPLLAIVGGIATMSKRKIWTRTDAGNEMAECIYGMKNFIHDFSNLSEAHKEQVVLWDDYLVYAAVLEENQQIVKEIMKRRNEKW